MAHLSKFASTIAIALSLSNLIACGDKSSVAVPELRYVSVSEKGIELDLENGSALVIQFRGVVTDPQSAEVWSDDSAIECEAANVPGWSENPFAVSDGGRPDTVEIKPLQRIRLLVPNPMPLRFKGGRCRVSIKLLDRTVIKTAEFRP
jgi:hypothetical protein